MTISPTFLWRPPPQTSDLKVLLGGMKSNSLQSQYLLYQVRRESFRKERSLCHSRKPNLSIHLAGPSTQPTALRDISKSQDTKGRHPIVIPKALLSCSMESVITIYLPCFGTTQENHTHWVLSFKVTPKDQHGIHTLPSCITSVEVTENLPQTQLVKEISSVSLTNELLFTSCSKLHTLGTTDHIPYSLHFALSDFKLSYSNQIYCTSYFYD